MRDERGEVLASGLHLRPFCGASFNDGYSPPVFDDELLAYVVRHANGSRAAISLW